MEKGKSEGLSNPQERLLSIESDPNRPLPKSVAKVIGKLGTFWEALGDERGFKRFLRALPDLKKEVDPGVLGEMLLCCAEQSSEVTAFVQQDSYSGRPFSSWKEAVENPTAFADFMAGWWITQVFELVQPREAVDQLVLVAARASAANAQLILDKAERDAAGGPMQEEPPYVLKTLLGQDAFDQVISNARRALEMVQTGARPSDARQTHEVAPNGPTISSAAVPTRDETLAHQPGAPADDGGDADGRRAQLDSILDQVTAAVKKALHARRLRLSANLSAKKLQALEGHDALVPLLPSVAASLDALERVLIAEKERILYTISPYREARAVQAVSNQRANAFSYVEALLADVIDDNGMLLAHKDAMAERLLQANHIIEKRVFDSGRFKAAMRQLGWHDTDDMDAILITSAEHMNSVVAMFKRHGISPDEMPGIEDVQNVTKVLKNRIRLCGARDGRADDNVLVIDRHTAFSELLDVYEEAYREFLPTGYESALAKRFAHWRTLLGSR